VRAYATNAIGTAYGTEITFTTPTGSSVATLDPSQSFRCWPVPSSGLIEMQWSDSDGAPTSIEVMALNGQIVHRIASLDYLSNNSAVINLTTLGLGFGSYRLRLLGQGKVIGQQQIVYSR